MNFRSFINRFFRPSETRINDPFKNQAIKEIEKVTKMKYSQINWIRKEGSSFYAPDIHPILLLDLVKSGWHAEN